MAEVTIIKRGGVRFPPSMTVILGGVEVHFTPAWADNDRVMIATIDGASPGAEAVLRQVAMMPTVYRIQSRSIQKVTQIEAPAKPAAEPPAPPMTPREIALRNGWTAGDLDGTGQGGEWGPEGGRSPVSGLTAAEMALCSPPKGWRRAAQWPWEAGAWRGPTAEWTPPGMPRKGQAQEGPRTSTPEVAALAPEPQPAPDSAPPATSPPAPSMDGYGTETEAAQARAVLRELTQAAGAPPTRQKATYHLRKHGLPSPSDQQFQALIQTLTP